MRLLALALVLMAPAANATLVTFDYRGAEYDYIRADGDSEGYYDFWNPWLERSRNNISGWLTIDTDYLPGHTIANQSFFVNPYQFINDCSTPGCSGTAIHAWEFFDGVFTSNVTDMNWIFMAELLFTLTTDGSGNLAAWEITLSGDPDVMALSSRWGDERGQGTCMDLTTSYFFTCARSSLAGTWTRRQVPEPSALALLAISLCGILLARRKGRRVRRLAR